MLDRETKAWLQSVFSKEQLAAEVVDKYCAEILNSSEGKPAHGLFFELAIVNADAAMVLLGRCQSSLVYRGEIAAGLLQKAYELSVSYASERIQGGKLIKDWSLVEQMLAEIFLQVHTNEKLVQAGLTEATAMAILKNSDHTVSLCLQVMGGAGYTEDYIVEKFFRHIHYLKNHPVPFARGLMDFYAKAGPV